MAKINLGLGTASWNRLSPRDIHDFLSFSYSLGYRYIDISPYYSGGRHEYILSNSNLRKTYNIVLKIGLPFTPWKRIERLKSSIDVSLNRQHYIRANVISKAVTNSLRRLKLETVSTVLLHSPPREILESDEYTEALLRLKFQGYCLDIGYSSDSINNSVPKYFTAIESDISSFPLPHENEEVKHFFFGVRRNQDQVNSLINRYPCAGSCTFTLLTGSTDRQALHNFVSKVFN